MTDLETFTAAYFEAMDFFDIHHPDSDIPDGAELSDESRLDMEADCRSFWRRFGCYVTSDACSSVNTGHSGPVARAGHDFWLTRNGHGAGFWDGDWPSPYADILDKGARAYGEVSPYLGDNGQVYTG